MLNGNTSAPLEGVRVLDLGRYQAGPRCGLMLARLGADVIKVEPPGGEESRDHGPYVRGQSAYWVQYNSGKRSLGLDLRANKGKAILRELVKVSDIFIQNFRPGTIDVMGFSYDVLKGLNRKIIMVNVSAYGQYGPYRDRVGFDQVGQAVSGLMMSNGDEGTPPIRATPPIIDRVTSLHATIGALAALWEAQRSGEGQSLDVALADSGYTLMEIPITYYKGSGKVERRTGNGTGTGWVDTYQTSDGWVYLIATGPDMWKRTAPAIGHPEWLDDPRFAVASQRGKQVDVIERELARWFAGHTAREAINTLSPLGVPIAQVNSVAEAAEDAHPWARDVLMEVPDPHAGTIHVSGNIMHYSRSGLSIGPTPTPGQHTAAILTGLLGMDEKELAALREEGVI